MRTHFPTVCERMNLCFNCGFCAIFIVEKKMSAQRFFLLRLAPGKNHFIWRSEHMLMLAFVMQTISIYSKNYSTLNWKLCEFFRCYSIWFSLPGTIISLGFLNLGIRMWILTFWLHSKCLRPVARQKYSNIRIKRETMKCFIR